MNIGYRVLVALCPVWAATVWAQDTRLALPPGPPAQVGKTVIFIASDYKNGGVMSVYRGLEAATHRLGWKLRLEDTAGKKANQAAMLARAISERPDGIVIGGFDPDDFGEQLAAAKKNRIVLVGWHAAPETGPTKNLFVNISTRPGDVAQMAVEHVIGDAKASNKPVGVVIFNDNQFSVANFKTAAMKAGIEACAGYKGCRVLAVANVRISEASASMPLVVPKLLASHGAAWTYSLAINDVYFDEINYPLASSGRSDIVNVSAGDGSSKALGRIRAGKSQQMATVAEPLKQHGYQIADELNRAFSGAPPSGFQSRPVLVTSSVLKAAGAAGIEAAAGVEAAYSAIWGRE